MEIGWRLGEDLMEIAWRRVLEVVGGLLEHGKIHLDIEKKWSFFSHGGDCKTIFNLKFVKEHLFCMASLFALKVMNENVAFFFLLKL